MDQTSLTSPMDHLTHLSSLPSAASLSLPDPDLDQSLPEPDTASASPLSSLSPARPLPSPPAPRAPAAAATSARGCASATRSGQRSSHGSPGRSYTTLGNHPCCPLSTFPFVFAITVVHIANASSRPSTTSRGATGPSSSRASRSTRRGLTSSSPGSRGSNSCIQLLLLALRNTRTNVRLLDGTRLIALEVSLMSRRVQVD